VPEGLAIAVLASVQPYRPRGGGAFARFDQPETRGGVGVSPKFASPPLGLGLWWSPMRISRQQCKFVFFLYKYRCSYGTTTLLGAPLRNCCWTNRQAASWQYQLVLPAVKAVAACLACQFAKTVITLICSCNTETNNQSGVGAAPSAESTSHTMAMMASELQAVLGMTPTAAPWHCML
jgi:hypothetical protein